LPGDALSAKPETTYHEIVAGVARTIAVRVGGGNGA